jgi:hypothetical protein
MPDVVCRCGTYVRAYVESGTKINCPQCGVVLTMGPSLNSPGPDITVSDIPGSDIPEPLEYQASRKTDNLAGSRKKFLLPMIFLILLATVGAISMFALGRKGFSEWSPWHEASQNQDDQLLLPPLDQDALPPTPPVTQSTSLWSASGNWQTTFSKIPLGGNIQALSEEISRLGASMNPSDFWDRIDHSDKSKPSTEANRLVDYLETLPIDSLSSIANTSSSDWRVLGFQQSEGELGVLIRYFYEPLSIDPDNSGEWVLACRQILSQEELAKATQEISRSISEISTLDPTESPTADLRTTPKHLLLTPRFGYLVLVFQEGNGQVVCTDLVGIPGDVTLSQTAAANSKRSSGEEPSDVPLDSIDVFGQYQSPAGRSLAGSVYFRTREDQTYTIADIRRFIGLISDPRAKRLAEIAEAATIDPSQLSSRVTRFRKEFPNDLGIDSLLISLWFAVDKGKRTSTSYDEVGKAYVESAHRLYMKTSDPLMLEIKSRIYRFHGRTNDADKSLLDAEKEDHQSIYLLERRIQDAIDAGNKQLLIDYLAKLNQLSISQSATAINPAIQAKWKQLLGN